MEQYSTPNVLTNHQCTIGILDVIFYNNIKSYQCHPHRGSSTNTFVSTPDISFSAIFSCILGGQSMSLSVRRISTPSCFTRTSFPDESKSRFNSLQSMDNFVLVQTSPCGEVWFEIWLKAHGKFSKAHGKIEITRELWAKSQITPLRRVMFAIKTTTTSSWVCFTQSAQKNCALWIFLCALG